MPATTEIISLKPGVEKSPDTPVFSVEYCHKTFGKSLLRFTALPLQLVMNELCIQQLLGFFVVPRGEKMLAQSNLRHQRHNHVATSLKHTFMKPNELINLMVSNSSSDTTNDTSPAAAFSSTEGAAERVNHRIDIPLLSSSVNKGIDIIFELDTPKIIIPEASTRRNTGFLLLDAGHLVVRGFANLEGMAWDITLSSVNAGLNSFELN
jgi:hypothetical protein